MALPTHVDNYEPGNMLIDGTLEVAGGVTVGGSALALAPGVASDGDEGLTINESLSVGENAAIVGNETVGGTLGVTGATTLAALAAGQATLTTVTGVPQLKLTPDSVLTAAPSAGAHNAGEISLDKNGGIHVCITSGTPGTWKTVTVS